LKGTGIIRRWTPEEAERLVEEALERGRVEPEAYWSQRAGMEWN